ncbi:hypothetical protein VTL71DRAFT_7560 [Oculimacula yallundae]|uniref:Uncharacterized protein n=1 Tax=Oculimacula yallundae TaxID=86028 RepID=A0ABR4BUG7_9HELO
MPILISSHTLQMPQAYAYAHAHAKIKTPSQAKSKIKRHNAHIPLFKTRSDPMTTPCHSHSHLRPPYACMKRYVNMCMLKLPLILGSPSLSLRTLRRLLLLFGTP